MIRSSFSSRNLSPYFPRALSLLALLALVAGGCGGKTKAASAPPPATIDFTPNGALAPNTFVSSVAILAESAGIGIVSSSAFGTFVPANERLYPFDPLTGARGVSVSASRPLTFSPPLPDSNGALVSATTSALPAFAATANGKLYVTTNNYESATQAYAPGSVLVYDYDVAANRIGSFQSAIVLTASAQVTANPDGVLYNAGWIAPFERPGEAARLVVVCAAPYFSSLDAAIAVIDPATDRVAEAVTLGATTLSAGRAALRSDLHLYVGSGIAPELFVVDLATSPPTLVRGPANPVTVTSTSSGDNDIASVALSGDGERLLALNFNDAALTIFSLAASATQPTPVTRVGDFKRGLATSDPNYDFEQNAISIAVRPGRAGVDFTTGPDLVVASTAIQAAQQVVPGIQTALDAVTSYASPVSVSLNAVVSPFAPAMDIQDVVAPAFGGLSGTYFAVQGQSGRIVTGSFSALR